MRPLQIHLSTAIVVTIAAGGILGLNMKPPAEDRVSLIMHDDMVNLKSLAFCKKDRSFGWPCTVMSQSIVADDPHYKLIESYKHRAEEILRVSDTAAGKWNWPSVVFDVLIAVGLLAVVAFACEWYVRRR
jgi:hypothetical protein